MKETIYVIGCGDIGVRVARYLSPAGYHIVGVRRDPGKLPADVEGCAADYVEAGSLDFLEKRAPAVVIATFTPTSFTPEGYAAGFTRATQNLLTGIGGHRPRLVIMASSTRVYAEREGAWATEDSPLAWEDPMAAAIIQAERKLIESGMSATVVRFGGIYGNPNGRLLASISQGRLSPPAPLRYGNRIHRDDAAGFLAHLVQRRLDGHSLEIIYNGVDDKPTPLHEVESWLARQLGKDLTGNEPAPGRKYGHKRISNERLHASGYRLRYPEYRSGYSAVLAHLESP